MPLTRLYLLILVPLLSVGCIKKVPAVDAEKGFLDLSGPKHLHSLVRLNGQWEIYRDTLLTPADLNSADAPKASYLSIPGTWKGMKIDNRTTPGTGCATFRLRLRLPEKKEHRILKLYSVHCAYRVWVNGLLCDSLGVVAESKKSMVPSRSPKMICLPTDAKEIDLVLQVSNFHYRAGGINTPIILGETKDLIGAERMQTAVEFFLAGAILIMALYHLIMYSLRKRDIASLYFGLFCLVTFFRSLVTGEMFLASLFGVTNYGLHIRIEYLTVYLMVPLFVLYTRQLFPKEVHKTPTAISLLIASVFVLITLLTPVFLFTHLIPVYHPILILQFIWLTAAIAFASLRKRRGAAILFFGFVFIFLATIYDMLFTWIDIEGKYILPVGIFLFLISQTYVLSARFADAFKTIEDAKEEQRNLSMLQSRLAHMLDSVADAVLALDNRMQIRYMNKACRRLFEHPDSITDTPIESLMQKEEDRFTQYLNSMSDDNRAFENVQLKLGSKKVGAFRIVVSRCSYEQSYIPVLILRKVDSDGKLDRKDRELSVESLITELNRNTHRLNLFKSTIDTLSPQLFEDNPHLSSDLEAIGQTLSNLNSLLLIQTSDSAKREFGVKMLTFAIEVWESETGLKKSDLAEQSGLWNVQIDKDGWRRTQTLDKYLDIHTIPRNPKWKKIEKTVDFVLSVLNEKSQRRQELKRMSEAYKMNETLAVG